ncbi:hypothetical protein JMM63_01615 [Rhodovulum sulfidophilum]|uniref:hypothetical protein n=1 Tax=Rhodovulum sulfidophilum TaxID=35806 RepID=UPI00192445FA|nr:hypothetical protein [Rhodovulum sulfidophilum]MBL3594283.1 hypothetical protein [Rhodovulum sulfidophilum]
MAKMKFKGIPVGEKVTMTVRDSAGNTLVTAQSPAWAQSTTPAEVPGQVNTAADLGIVSSIPFNAIAANIEAVEVLTQPSYGHVSVVGTSVLVNTVDVPEIRAVTTEPVVLRTPENPLSKMVNNLVKSTDPITFTLRVTQAGQSPQDVTVVCRIDAHLSLSGWSCGRGMKLAVDNNDETVLEPGEKHFDLYVSLSPAAYTRADIMTEIGGNTISGKVDDYIVAQLTPGGATISGVTIAYDPINYYGSQAKPVRPIAAAGLVTELLEEHGFDTVHIHYERGYDYSTDRGAANFGKAGLLHPNAVLAWGEGAKPIVPRARFNGNTKKHGMVFRGVQFPLGQGLGGSGGTNVIVENCLVPAMIYFYGQDAFGYPARFTVRNSILPHSFAVEDVRDGTPDYWAGDYRPACIKPGGGSNGIIIEGNFLALGAFAPDFALDNGADGLPGPDDVYPFIDVGSDSRWGLNGFSTPGPNLLAHPMYCDTYTRHIQIRKNFIFGSGGSLIQLRGGAVMYDCAFTWGNQTFSVGPGTFNNYSSEVFDDRNDGHKSWLHDVVLTHAGYHDGPQAGNALSEGIVVGSALTSLDRVVILHDIDPNNPADADRLVSSWNGASHGRKSGFKYSAAYEAGGKFENYHGRERDLVCANWGSVENPDYNPGSLDLSNINNATLFRWYDAQRGNAPDTTTDPLDIYWWLRGHEGPEIKALVRSFVTFMQAPLGIVPTWRTSASGCSFVPDLAEDGCRWDNTNNWGRDLIPGSFAGDTAALNGHKVFYQLDTLTVAGLDLGAGGHLHAVNGRLNVSAAPVCTGSGAITVDESGQVWVNGYTDTDPLTVTVKGGRFANTGTFSGPADIHVDGSTDPYGKAEFLCAYGAASMTVTSGRKMEIVGSGPRVGFDGTGGMQARLSFESGAVLSFVAKEGRLATIREFRSGVNGTATPDVVSTVALGGAALMLDLTGVAVGSHVLVSVDNVIGTFGSITGKIDPRLDATVTVTAKGVSLSIGSGSGQIRLT